MPKFNPNSIENLFNAESLAAINSNKVKDKQEARTDNSSIINIDIYDIIPNSYNEGISMNGIAELKENIGLVGLQQNLLVCPPKDGKYILIAGHRRLAALKSLVEDDGRNEFRKVPAMITNPEELKYNLSSESKNALYWVSSNVTSRQPTNQDLIRFIGTLNDVYDELRRNNPGITIGTKKEYMSNQLNISESQVQILNAINSHLTEDALTAFLNNKLSLVVARDLSKISEKWQKIFLDRYDDLTKITAKDVSNFKEEIKEKREENRYKIEEYKGSNFIILEQALSEIIGKTKDITLTGDAANKAQNITDAIWINIDRLKKIFEIKE